MRSGAGFNERAMATTSGGAPETRAEAVERLDREFLNEAWATLGDWLEDKGLDVNDPALQVVTEAVPKQPFTSSGSYRAPDLDPPPVSTISFVKFAFEIDEHRYHASCHSGNYLSVMMFIQPGPEPDKLGHVQVDSIEDIGAALHEEQRRIAAHGSAPLTRPPDYIF